MKNYLVLVMLKKNENIDYKMALAEVIIKTFIKNEGENMKQGKNKCTRRSS